MSVFIGHNQETGANTHLPLESMFQSTYIIGRTGMGKSALIQSMVLQQIHTQDCGLCVIDPHGELVDEIIKHLPTDRDDVILLDASDGAHPFGINLFDCQDTRDPVVVSRTVDQTVGIFHKIWGEAWGPRLEDLLRNVAHTMIENKGMTLHEVPRLLYDADFRQILMSNVSNQIVLDFWEYEYNRMSQRDQREFRASTTNRVRAFLSNPLVRHIVGQTGTTVDVPRAMDAGMVVLVKLPVGIIGEDATSLIGSVIVRELLQAAMTRGTSPLPFMIYCDEYHRFATPDFATLIEESRKYRVGTILSHQRRDQLLENHRSIPLSAVNLIAFQVMGEDARSLVENFKVKPQPGEPRLEMVTKPVYRRWTEEIWTPPSAETEHQRIRREAELVRQKIKLLEDAFVLNQWKLDRNTNTYAEDGRDLIARQFHVDRFRRITPEEVSRAVRKSSRSVTYTNGATKKRVSKQVWKPDADGNYFIGVPADVPSEVEAYLDKKPVKFLGTYKKDVIVSTELFLEAQIWLRAELEPICRRFRQRHPVYAFRTHKDEPLLVAEDGVLEPCTDKAGKQVEWEFKPREKGIFAGQTRNSFFYKDVTWQTFRFAEAEEWVINTWRALSAEYDQIIRAGDQFKKEHYQVREHEEYLYDEPVKSVKDSGPFDSEERQRYRWVEGDSRPISDIQNEMANELSNLPPYTARVRLRDTTGMEEATIVAALHNLPETHITDRVISRSRNDYATKVATVIKEIEARGHLESPPEVYEDREPPAKRKVQIRRAEPL